MTELRQKLAQAINRLAQAQVEEDMARAERLKALDEVIGLQVEIEIQEEKDSVA
jgi:hypothetical protein